MGKVALIFNVTPSSASCDIEKMEHKIKEIKGVTDVKTEEIGFGVKILKVLAVVENPEEATRIEEEIRKMDEVSEIQTESTTLV